MRLWSFPDLAVVAEIGPPRLPAEEAKGATPQRVEDASFAPDGASEWLAIATPAAVHIVTRSGAELPGGPVVLRPYRAGYAFRCARFLCLGEQVVLVTIENGPSSSTCPLISLWSTGATWQRRRKSPQRLPCRDRVTAMSISCPDNAYIAFGTAAGSVGVYDASLSVGNHPLGCSPRGRSPSAHLCFPSSSPLGGPCTTLL